AIAVRAGVVRLDGHAFPPGIQPLFEWKRGVVLVDARGLTGAVDRDLLGDDERAALRLEEAVPLTAVDEERASQLIAAGCALFEAGYTRHSLASGSGRGSVSSCSAATMSSAPRTRLGRRSRPVRSRSSSPARRRAARATRGVRGPPARSAGRGAVRVGERPCRRRLGALRRRSPNQRADGRDAR